MNSRLLGSHETVGQLLTYPDYAQNPALRLKACNRLVAAVIPTDGIKEHQKHC